MRHFLVALSLLVLSQQAASSITIYGEARATGDRRLLYTEEHFISESGHGVNYRFPDGRPLANKYIDYRSGYRTPQFELHDLRFDRKSGSRHEPGENILWQEHKNGSRQERRLEESENLVIDAGFDHYILENFNLLSGGKNLDFTFAIADPPMAIDMLLEKIDCKEDGFFKSDLPHSCLRARIKNTLLRWFIPDINLAYINDVSLNRPVLAVYQGPSNLTDNDDKAQTVRIQYRYKLPDEVKQ